MMMIQQTRLASLPQREGGFTLIELMLVVAIVALLAGIGYPNYLDYLQKSRRSDATSTLMQVAAKQEQYFMDNRVYTADLRDLDYTKEGTTADPLVTENGYYEVVVALVDSAGNASTYNYLLTATPTGPQANDSTCDSITLNSEGVKAAEDNNNNDTTDTCW